MCCWAEADGRRWEGHNPHCQMVADMQSSQKGDDDRHDLHVVLPMEWLHCRILQPNAGSMTKPLVQDQLCRLNLRWSSGCICKPCDPHFTASDRKEIREQTRKGASSKTQTGICHHSQLRDGHTAPAGDPEAEQPEALRYGREPIIHATKPHWAGTICPFKQLHPQHVPHCNQQ